MPLSYDHIMYLLESGEIKIVDQHLIQFNNIQIKLLHHITTGKLYVTIDRKVYEFPGNDSKPASRFFVDSMEKLSKLRVVYLSEKEAGEDQVSGYDLVKYDYFQRNYYLQNRVNRVYESEILPGLNLEVYLQVEEMGTHKWINDRYFLVLGNWVLRAFRLGQVVALVKSLESGRLFSVRPDLTQSAGTLPRYDVDFFTPYRRRLIVKSTLIDHYDFAEGTTSDIYQGKSRVYMRYKEFIYTFQSLSDCMTICKLLATSAFVVKEPMLKDEQDSLFNKLRKRINAYFSLRENWAPVKGGEIVLHNDGSLVGSLTL